MRLIELEGPGEGSSSGAQLALTDSELDPELEGNGAGKLNDINQRQGISICILELSEAPGVEEMRLTNLQVSEQRSALQGPGD